MSRQRFYLRSTEEMAALFPDYPEAIENTGKIAERCNLEFTFGKYHLPEFKVPEGYTSLTYFKKLCADGASPSAMAKGRTSSARSSNTSRT